MAGSSAFPLSLEVRELIMWSYHRRTDGLLDRGMVVQLVSDLVIVTNNARKEAPQTDGGEEAFWPAKGSQELLFVWRSWTVRNLRRDLQIEL